jgi:hypothetical protein
MASASASALGASTFGIEFLRDDAGPIAKVRLTHSLPISSLAGVKPLRTRSSAARGEKI